MAARKRAWRVGPRRVKDRMNGTAREIVIAFGSHGQADLFEGEASVCRSFCCRMAYALEGLSASGTLKDTE